MLVNTPVLREQLMRWLADHAGLGKLPALGSAAIHVATEQAIETKRDDLRITAADPDTDAWVLLWTVELKVFGGFNYSSPIRALHERDDGPARSDEVHQVRNYDAWLAKQDVQEDVRSARAGFVLSTDPTITLPEGLECPWKPLTWTELGLRVERAIIDDSLPPGEAVLAKHLAGFIRDHLWTHTMTENPIRFDDLALLRAHASYGAQTQERVDGLVARLVPLLERSGLKLGPIKHSRKMFMGHRRSMVWTSTNPDAKGDLPWLMAGIISEGIPKLAVWLETEPKHANKMAGCEAVRENLAALHERNVEWHAHPAHEASWQDLSLRAPLEPILGASNQVQHFEEFFTKAFADLHETGVAAALAEAYR
ncbi:hypothetical protein [Enhygromyxa salina]|uniref:hypothetical protein n=1 Tax=Enhygromyxa salina TaxID=215803 RepID=UPI0015E5D3F3|nr:hypothetical protein [Enhygromyxa salina]